VITTKVKAAILNDATLKVNEINVETFKGVVQLSGFVRSGRHQPDCHRRTRGCRREVRQNDMRIK
jgi:osmotically-inducible protein OsmY